MEWKIIGQLKSWKVNPERKPLILLGARQVGKTWVMKHFGQTEFQNVAYINCDEEPLAKELFAADYNIPRILLTLQAITGTNIEAGKTLIIFDELQEVERGLHSLKYFQENTPEYHVMAAGEADLCNLLHQPDWEILKILSSKYIDFLRQYYYVGGMPEVVDHFVQHHDLQEQRVIPVEVKAEENVRARSMSEYIKSHPEYSLKGLRISMMGYQDQDWMENIPLYAISKYFG